VRFRGYLRGDIPPATSPCDTTDVGARILVAEDDPKQAQRLRLYLEREGHSVVVALDGRIALDQARQKQPDLVILDLMMPRVDGFDVCRVLRAESSVPIIMLTARSGEDDLLLGLDLGADDYIAKPYSPRELVARVRTVLRRSSARTGARDGPYRVGAIEVDPARHEVRVGGRLVDCTAAEVKVLACLLAEPGRVFTRQQLLDQAFGFDHYALERTVDAHIKNLRRKLEPDPARPAHLLTVYGVGYKFADASDAGATEDDAP
jgi:DNA-binding response OmpR family regulator